MKKSKPTSLQSIIWVGLEKFSQSIIALVTLGILARILTPDDFGLVAIAYFGVSISRVLVEAGLGSALIHKKVVTDDDYSTIFVYNMGVALGLYLILFISSPYIAAFYAKPELNGLIRVLSLILLINAVTITQRTQLQRELQFKTLLKLTLIAIIIASISAICYAFYNPNPYALVINHLIFALVFSILLVRKVKFRPSLVFNTTSFKSMYSYGTQLLGSSLIITFYNELVILLVGKYYANSTTGIISQGRKLADYQMSIYRALFDGAGFPILAKQRDSKKFNIALRNLHKQVFQIAIPIIMFSVFFSKKVIITLLGEQWVEASFVFQILSVGIFFVLIESGAKNVLKALGLTSVILRVETGLKSIGILAISLGILHSWQLVIGLFALVQAFGGLVGIYTNARYANHSVLNQIKDLAPYLLISFCAASVAYIVEWQVLSGLQWNNFVLLILLGTIYIFCYGTLMQMTGLFDFKKMLRQ